MIRQTDGGGGDARGGGGNGAVVAAAEEEGAGGGGAPLRAAATAARRPAAWCRMVPYGAVACYATAILTLMPQLACRETNPSTLLLYVCSK